MGQGTVSSLPTQSETDNTFSIIFSLEPIQMVFWFIFQINSVVLKEDLRSMVENFYAALFGYDEVRRMFSENVQEQVDCLIHEHRILHMGKSICHTYLWRNVTLWKQTS